MSKRLNERFLSSYIELEKTCCEKFGVPTGGVTEYINRLNNARFAPGRDEALPRLVRYRGIRNKIAHEISVLRSGSDATKADITWIKKFNREVLRRKDPISTYLRHARRLARRRRVKRYVTFGAFILLVMLIIVLLILFLK
mgnify:FL=1